MAAGRLVVLAFDRPEDFHPVDALGVLSSQVSDPTLEFFGDLPVSGGLLQAGFYSVNELASPGVGNPGGRPLTARSSAQPGELDPHSGSQRTPWGSDPAGV